MAFEGDPAADHEVIPEEEELDPRIQVELEKLNTCTDEINQLEKQLDDANCLFRTLLQDSTHQLKSLAKKLGSCIEKARPFYEAQETSQKLQKECQTAATNFQRANGVYAAAKETIALAEERFLSNSSDWEFDNAWQEMLNHATIKVMEAEKMKTLSEEEHMKRAELFTAAEQEVQQLEKKLKKHIQKSQPYFEQKEAFNRALESQKHRVQQLQSKVTSTKALYAKSLRNLEEISESIHAQRKLRLPREPGVGAELDSLPSFDLDKHSVFSSATQSSRNSLSGAASEDDDNDVVLEDKVSRMAIHRKPGDERTKKTVTGRSVSCPAMPAGFDGGQDGGQDGVECDDDLTVNGLEEEKKIEL